MVMGQDNKDDIQASDTLSEMTQGKPLGAVTFAEGVRAAGAGTTQLTRIAGILLQAAQLAGLAALVIDVGDLELPIFARNRRASAVIPNIQASLRNAGGIDKMTFFEIHSHLLLVAAGGEQQRSVIALHGDPLGSRRRTAIVKLLPDAVTDRHAVLLIGPSVSWHDAADPTAPDPIETLLRLHRLAKH